MFSASGGFDPALVCNEDLEWLIRLVGHGARIIGLDALQTYFRTSAQGLSSDLPGILAGRDRVRGTAARYSLVPTAKSHAIQRRYLAQLRYRGVQRERHRVMKQSGTGISAKPSSGPRALMLAAHRLVHGAGVRGRAGGDHQIQDFCRGTTLCYGTSTGRPGADGG